MNSALLQLPECFQFFFRGCSVDSKLILYHLKALDILVPDLIWAETGTFDHVAEKNVGITHVTDFNDTCTTECQLICFRTSCDSWPNVHSHELYDHPAPLFDPKVEAVRNVNGITPYMGVPDSFVGSYDPGQMPEESADTNELDSDGLLVPVDHGQGHYINPQDIEICPSNAVDDLSAGQAAQPLDTSTASIRYTTATPSHDEACAPENSSDVFTAPQDHGFVPLPSAWPRFTSSCPWRERKPTANRESCSWPYRCFVCQKQFTRAFNLRSHMRTHTGERPFNCSVCGRTFARQHDKQRHESLHFEGSKYICPGECGRKFARKDGLRRHLRSPSTSKRACGTKRP